MQKEDSEKITVTDHRLDARLEPPNRPPNPHFAIEGASADVDGSA